MNRLRTNEDGVQVCVSRYTDREYLYDPETGLPFVGKREYWQVIRSDHHGYGYGFQIRLRRGWRILGSEYLRSTDEGSLMAAACSILDDIHQKEAEDARLGKYPPKRGKR